MTNRHGEFNKMSKNTLTFFTDEIVLTTLTGLSGSELYAAGFPHQNWTWGFVSDVPYVRHVVADEYGDIYEYTELRYDAPQYIRQLIDSMTEGNGYYKCVDYGNKYYYFQCHT